MAIFGKTTNGTQSSGYTVDTKAVSVATPASSGTVTSLTARLYLSSAGSTKARGVIYTNNGLNEPGALLAVTEEFTVSGTVETAYTANFSGENQIDITEGTNYWIGVHVQDPGGLNLVISRDNTYGYQKNSSDTYSDGPSDPFGNLGSTNGPIDVYVTYEEATGTTYAQAVGGGTVSPTGALARTVTYGLTTGGASIHPTGGLAKMTSKTAGGFSLAPQGGLSRSTSKSVGGATVSPAAGIATASLLTSNVGGWTISPSGALSRVITWVEAVGGAILSPDGALARMVSKGVGEATVSVAGGVWKKTSRAVGGFVATAIGAVTSRDVTNEEPEEVVMEYLRKAFRSLRNRV